MAKVSFSKLGLSKNNTIKSFEYNGQNIEVKQYLPIQENNSLGEYIDGYEAPLFTHNDQLGLNVLDQHYYIDDDGSIYVYYSVYHSNNCQYIVGVKMIDLLTPDWSTYKKLVYPGALSPETASFKPLGWENYTSAFPVAEGPYMIKSPVNGKYYLTYSVNHYPDRYYTVCYAVSDTPLGDFTKPYTAEDKANNRQWTNLVFGYAGPLCGDVFDDWGGFNSGTAHHCFFKIGDQYMIGYHAHKNRSNDSQGRMFAMDKLFFDDEGVPCKTKLVVENGVFNGFLHNLKTANFFKTEPTGNGFKLGVAGAVSTRPTNLFIKEGNKTKDEIIATVEDGLYITDVQGLHAGLNPVSGDFSAQASGFRIEQGKITYPVSLIVVSGNFLKLLQDVVIVGNDEFISYNGVSAPSIKVRELSISGK